MFHGKWVLSQRLLLVLAAFMIFVTEAQAQNYSLGFLPVPDTYSWTPGPHSTVVTVKNNGATTIPAGLTLYVENRMLTWKPGRTLLPTTSTLFGPKVTPIPGSCAGTVSPSSYAVYGCRVTLNSNFLPGETFDAKFTFTVNAGSALTPGGPNNELNDCGTGWLTTPGPWTWTGAALPGWTFLNAYGGHGEVGCGNPPPPVKNRDVRIRKLASGSSGNTVATVAVGGVASFSLSAQNLGPGAVSSVIVTDTLPTGFGAPVTVSGGLNWTCGVNTSVPPTVTCQYGGLPVNPPGLFLPPIVINATALTAGKFENCAQIALNMPGYTDPTLSNNKACVPVIITADPKKDVGIRKLGGGTVQAGGPVSFTLRSWNNGPAPVTSGSVTITDTLPPGLSNVTFTFNPSGSPLPWTCIVNTPSVPLTITCNYVGPTIAPGGSSSGLPAIMINATASIAGNFKNCATIAFTSGVDSQPQDNSSCVPVVVEPAPKGNVGIRKLIAPVTVSLNGQVTFTLAPFNYGPGSVSSVTVTDILPGTLTLNSASGYPWNCTILPSVTCQYIGLPVVASLPFPPITIQATANTPGKFENCAEIALGNGLTDTSLADNKDCRTYGVTNVPPQNDVGVKKQGGGTVYAGDPVSFTLQPFNNGPGSVSSVTITDTGLAGLTAITATTATGSGWTCPSTAGNWTGTCTYTGPPSIPIGYFPPILIQATSLISGEFMNCAEITLTGDPDLGNNKDCRPYAVKAGSITIYKDAQPEGSQAFQFTTTGTGLSGFSLTDNVFGPSNTKTFPNLAAGSYSVTEIAAGNGWTLTGVSCNTTAGILVTGATVDIALQAGANVICVFTNAKPQTGSLTIVKDAQPNDAQDFGFHYSLALSACCLPHLLDDDAGTGTAAAESTLSHTHTYSNLVSGDYGVSEDQLPAGWTLDSIVCLPAGTGTVILSSQFVTVNVAPGANVSCTFTNKKTPPPPPPLTAGCVSAITGQVGVSYSSTVTVSGGTPPYTFSIGSGTLPPGLTLNAATGVISGNPTTAGSFSYAVTVTDSSGGAAGSGLTFTTASCRITITTVPQGTITIRKVAQPQGTQAFHFTTTGGALPSAGVYLDDDGNPASGYSNSQTFTLPLGAQYFVTEDALNGWSLANVVCTFTGGTGWTYLATGVTVSLVGTGASADCTFTNTKLGSLTVVKVTQPNDPQVFHFATTGLPGTGFDLDNASSNTYSNSKTFTNLANGVPYTVIEDAMSGWTIGSIGWVVSPPGLTLTSDNSVQRLASVTLAGGADVTVTFTNVKSPCSTTGYVLQGGLCWMPISATAMTWTQANNFCSTSTIDGLTGWRLPTQAELLALFASQSMNGKGWALDWTWSSTFNGNSHNIVHLVTGGTSPSNALGLPDTSSLYFSCVRP